MGRRVNVFVAWCAMLLALCFFVVLLVAMSEAWNGGGQRSAVVAQREAERARYEAEQAAAELALVQARADVERARGERAVLEAAADAVEQNTRLVDWYARRGDVRAVLFVVGLAGLAVCAGLVLTVGRRWYDAQKHAEE